MKSCRVAVIFASLFAFYSATPAQVPPAVSEEEAPILVEAQPLTLPQLFGQQTQPEPPSTSALLQSDASGSLAIEDRYRAEIKLLAQKEHQFVHCKLKNGKVLTGRLGDPGDKIFLIRTNALGDGTPVEYKNLSELPRAVPAVGTRIKQGAQLTAFVVFVVVFFVPLALTGVIPSC